MFLGNFYSAGKKNLDAQSQGYNVFEPNSENFPAQQTVLFGADTCQRQKMEEYFWDCVVFPQLKGSLCEVCFG